MADVSAISTPNRALAIIRGWHVWLEANPLVWSGALFIAALGVFTAFQMQVIPGMGMWYDELFSLWAGDPTISFGDAFATRILPDTNGPIYFSLVYFVQAIGLADRTAFLVLNYTAIGALLAFILARGWRHDLLATALSSVALLLVTAPLLLYAPEGRVYGLVMAVCAVPAFEAGRLLSGGQASRSDLILVAIIGVLAAWLHVFGAIFIGSLAAAMIVVGAFLLRRRDVVIWGFVAGIATSVALVVWLAIAFPLFTGTTSWIEFHRTWVFNMIWELKNYMIGPMVGVIIAGAFVGLSLIPRHSRPFALAIVISTFLLFAIPMAVSFKMPIFLQRYLLIGFPALLVLCVFLIRSHLIAREGARGGRQGIVRQGLSVLGALVLVFPILQGIPTARETIRTRGDWVGSQLVLQAANACPAGEVRAATFTPFAFGFTYYLKGALKPIDPSEAPMRDISQIDCPVFAWGEHLGNAFAAEKTIDDVLADFHLTNTTGLPLVLIHHQGGFVLARAEAQLN